MKEELNKLYETSDYAIIADIMCRGPFEKAVKLRGYENFLIDLSTNSEFTSVLLEKITEIIIGLWDVYLAAVGDQVQVVCQGDDIVTQTGLIISKNVPQIYQAMP